MFTSFHCSHLLRTGMPGIVLFLLLTITSHGQAETKTTSANGDIYADTKWTWAKIEPRKVEYHTAKVMCEELPKKNPDLKWGTWTLPTQEQVESFYRNLIVDKKESFKGWTFGDIWLLSTKASNNKFDMAHLKNGTLSWGKKDKTAEMLVACVTQSKPAEFKPVNNELKTYVDNNGLTWLKPKNSDHFENSNSLCQNEAKDNHKPWRLPTVKELMDFYYQVVDYQKNADTLAGFGWKLGFSWSSEQVGSENKDIPQHYTVKLSPAPNPGMPDGGAIYFTADTGQKAYAVCVHD